MNARTTTETKKIISEPPNHHCDNTEDVTAIEDEKQTATVLRVKLTFSKTFAIVHKD